HGRRDEYDEVIIEATGIADPRGLAEPFIIHPAIKKQFPLKGIICLVDAELIEDQIEETKEAIHQVTFSDVLLINKIDLVDKEYLSQLSKKLERMNPLAKIVSGHQGDFPSVEAIRHTDNLDHTCKSSHQNEKTNNFPVQKPNHHHHHEHTQVVSITINFKKPFNYQTLRHVLTVYLTLQAKDLYRMKGLLWLKDMEEQYLLQAVGKRHSIDIKRPWKATEQKESTIVFIGKDIKREGLERMLAQCLVQ
ncbi:MAG: CobW family GTP-binding protein, partial [Saprospiraceae bacterium]